LRGPPRGGLTADHAPGGTQVPIKIGVVGGDTRRELKAGAPDAPHGVQRGEVLPQQRERLPQPVPLNFRLLVGPEALTDQIPFVRVFGAQGEQSEECHATTGLELSHYTAVGKHRFQAPQQVDARLCVHLTDCNTNNGREMKRRIPCQRSHGTDNRAQDGCERRGKRKPPMNEITRKSNSDTPSCGLSPVPAWSPSLSAVVTGTALVLDNARIARLFRGEKPTSRRHRIARFFVWLFLTVFAPVQLRPIPDGVGSELS
jgi:hypothetical protein